MISIVIGITSAGFTILLVGMLQLIHKSLDKKQFYALILAGIGFLYVGFTWKDLHSLIINCLQAVFFLCLAYYGFKKSTYILAAGYILHGCWDLAYHFIAANELIPPHYDLFCSSLDFTVAIYLLAFNKALSSKISSINIFQVSTK